jgi:hypothetical protein
MSITNLRSADGFRNSFWDWTPFNPCFITAKGQATNIKISDIDGSVERNGHFLIIETKRPNEEMKLGQKRYLRASVRRADTVILLVGNPNDPEFMWLARPNSDPKRIEPCGINDVCRYVRGWFLWADANGFIDPWTAPF